jgi:hypothetical protein
MRQMVKLANIQVAKVKQRMRERKLRTAVLTTSRASSGQLHRKSKNAIAGRTEIGTLGWSRPSWTIMTIMALLSSLDNQEQALQ